MKRCCFVCNGSVAGISLNGGQDIYTECMLNGEVTTIATILSEIFDKPVPKIELHSNVICQQCYNTCKQYDTARLQVLQLKTKMANQFKLTLPQYGYCYNTFPKKMPAKKLVLPASKLHPLPSDYVINVANLLSPQKNVPKTLNLITSPTKETTVTRVKTTSQFRTDNADANIQTTINNTLATILNSKDNAVEIRPETVPIQFLSSAVLTKINDQKVVKIEIDDEELKGDERAMEIVDECTSVQVGDNENEIFTEESAEKPMEPEYLDMNLLPLSEGEQDDGEETQTIVVTGENGSILRIMSGQNLVYDNGEISLVSDDETSNQDNDNNDGHDSNDESQIELQVSGDEETANAIIAAAKEQGGAFIKVESGEMFRVKSVKSKPGESQEDKMLLQMLAQEGDNFKCLLCEKEENENTPDVLITSVLRDAAAMMLHLKLDHDARVYICHICKRVIRRRSDYTAHLEEHSKKMGKLAIQGEKGKQHECKQCKKKYHSRTLLQEHMNSHSGVRPYSCSVCEKTFTSKYTHQAHLKTHSDRPRPYKCSECPKSFLSAHNLTQHAKTHTGVKDFVCKVCDKAFSTQHNLEVHGVVHSGNKPFVCGFCGKAFARRAEVKDHMRIHTGERPFACDLCGATFAQRSNLHSHRRITHLNDRRYPCTAPGCGKKFKRRRLLDYHTKAFHTGERPLQCAQCRATFVYPEHYKKHIRIHSGEKPFVCEVCGKSFNSRDNRNTHRFVHSDKKPYECLVCGAGYMRKQLLYAHMNSSGHLAESIVVNQPRVQKVKEKVPVKSDQNESITDESESMKTVFMYKDGDESQAATSTEQTVTTGTDETQLFFTGDKKFVLQDGKSTINLVQETDDPTLLTFIHNLDSSGKPDGSLQGMAAEQIGDQVQMVTSDENGSFRLVQFHINANPTWLVNQE